MSVQAAKAYLERLAMDANFTRQLCSFRDADKRMAFIKGSGYAFSFEELQSAVDGLSEEALESVVGGVGLSGADAYAPDLAESDTER